MNQVPEEKYEQPETVQPKPTTLITLFPSSCVCVCVCVCVCAHEGEGERERTGAGVGMGDGVGVVIGVGEGEVGQMERAARRLTRYHM